jgi:hypothetical protein
METNQAIVTHIRGQQHLEEPVTAIVPDAESAAIFVRWNWWQITQSDYHRREVGVVDLGNLDGL